MDYKQFAIDNARAQFGYPVAEGEISLTVGPYDKTLKVRCEYRRTDGKPSLCGIDLMRVWLGPYDITGYLSDSQRQALEEELETNLQEEA